MSTNSNRTEAGRKRTAGPKTKSLNSPSTMTDSLSETNRIHNPQTSDGTQMGCAPECDVDKQTRDSNQAICREQAAALRQNLVAEGLRYRGPAHNLTTHDDNMRYFFGTLERSKEGPGYFLNGDAISLMLPKRDIYEAEVIAVATVGHPKKPCSATAVEMVFAAYETDQDPERIAAIARLRHPIDWRPGAALPRVVTALLGRPLTDTEAAGGVHSRDLLCKRCKVRIQRTRRGIRLGADEFTVVEVLPFDTGHIADSKQPVAA